MAGSLLVCTDLDRTLIPNGPQPESPGARGHFASLAARPEVSLALVSGRDRQLVEQAIRNYHLPRPDFVIGDVGTTIYQVDADHQWHGLEQWAAEVAQDWAGQSHGALAGLLHGLTDLRLQERARQNRHKLSYYVPLQRFGPHLSGEVQRRLDQAGVRARLVWSVDEPAGIGLLDILPARASKYHAIEALREARGWHGRDTVFCGDSGNDLEVLASPIRAVLVANSPPEVRERALQLAAEAGLEDRLYIAQGGFMGMSGNYAGGMLEGIAHYFPYTVEWMGFHSEGAA